LIISIQPASSSSFSPRSDVISGQPLPNRMRSFSTALAYCSRCAGKHFGRLTDRSIQTSGGYAGGHPDGRSGSRADAGVEMMEQPGVKTNGLLDSQAVCRPCL
jgi:hypothetical protein